MLTMWMRALSLDSTLSRENNREFTPRLAHVNTYKKLGRIEKLSALNSQTIVSDAYNSTHCEITVSQANGKRRVVV